MRDVRKDVRALMRCVQDTSSNADVRVEMAKVARIERIGAEANL